MTSETTKSPYPQVEARPDLPALEEAVLAQWRAGDTFQKSIDMRPAGEEGANEFVFYDGPPFANGLPHYGHVLTSYAKDLIPRYQTMRGRRVERRFGWDCHGLPAEMAAEKQLGVSGRQAIQDFGIEKFNAHCRESVMRYTSEWERYVTRMARWVDFENDYKTMDVSYMESVMWAFQQLWKKGLIYEGLRVMPYSWACETPLSNFEIRLDDATRPRQDPAITVVFKLLPKEGDGAPLHLLAWTTTPWTLPSNLALAVGPDIEYTILVKDGQHWALGSGTLSKYEKQLGGAEVVGTCKGSDLVGRTYEPLFPYFAGHEGAFRVLGAEFVDTEEGTGIVHMAPGFGEEDQKICESAGLEIVVPVDEKGRFTSEVSDYEGMNVFEANKPIIRALKDRGMLVKHETYVHNYPHCWRTDTPIIYRAMSSWYVQVTEFRDRMVELNQNINWTPAHIKDGQFGKWLEGARDWSISRNRFWGSPIPIWKSDDTAYPRIDVYGSIDELERDFGVRLTDLHRPAIDELTRPNPDDPTGKSTMRRVPEVLDCWFESGSMPFAQVHYPFENREWFEGHFPADYIVEYTPQTRGWFYTLMVLGTALFDRHPFNNCVCHGVLVAQDGRKLSKRLQNYLDPQDAYERFGSDAMRWRLMSSPVLRGLEVKVDQDGKDLAEVIRLVIMPIWSAYRIFTLYANVDGYRAAWRTDSTGLLDRYILAKTRGLAERITASLDAYDIPGACAHMTGFIDALNNWYIRRSRGRFWGAGDTPDKRDAYDTLYTVLVTLMRLAAPLLPLISESIHTALTDEESVHLMDWPDANDFPEELELVRDMDRVREVCSVGHMLRESSDLRARLPLKAISIAGAWSNEIAAYDELVRDELNVKEVRHEESFEAHASLQLKPDGRALGPRIGKAMRDVNQAARAGDWKRQEDGTVEVAGQTLLPEEYELKLAATDTHGMQAVSSQDALVILDTEVTPELHAEGVARDLVRLIQQARKDADLEVTDRIEVRLAVPDEVQGMVAPHEAYVREQVLADELSFGSPADGARRWEVVLGGQETTLSIRTSGG